MSEKSSITGLTPEDSAKAAELIGAEQQQKEPTKPGEGQADQIATSVQDRDQTAAVSISGVISTVSAAEMDQLLKEEQAASQTEKSSALTWRERALREAITQIGYHSDPGTLYCNKYTDYFRSFRCEYWCADFVSWAFDYTSNRDKKLPWGNPSAVESFINWARKNHKIVSSPQPGDLFAYTNGDHIGFVRTLKGGNFISVEGNTHRPGYGGRWVWSHTRAVHGAYYFIRVS